MRTFVVALTLLVFALPALAQTASTGKSKMVNDGPAKGETKPKVDDKAYGNALGNLPDKKFDPWKDMR
jgi:hypothetical protein